MAATFSLPLPSRMRCSSATTPASGEGGRSTKSWLLAYAAADSPPRRPKTLMSSSELVPSRLAPWTDTQATSPAANRPGTTCSLSRMTCASMSVGTPPIA